MGLDVVEIVMCLEDEFGVQIPDAMAEMMATVGQTSQGIVELLRQQESPVGVCSTARSFYRLRRELVDRFEVDRKSVKLDVPIGMLVPPEGDGEWPAIADAAGLRRERRGLFKKKFPTGETSVRELIRSRCKESWRRLDGVIDGEAVFQRVREIVSEQLNIPIDQITKGSHWVKDLEAG